jgi:hypothetical protein
MASQLHAGVEPNVSRNEIDEAIHDAIRLFVGRGRRYSVKQLARGSGVPARMIESIMAPLDNSEFRPLARDHFWSIAAFLRAPFMNELLPKLAHMGAFDLPDEELPAPGELVSEIANDTAEVAHLARGGQYDPDDHRSWRNVGERSVERGMQMIANARQWIKAHTPRRKAA